MKCVGLSLVAGTLGKRGGHCDLIVENLCNRGCCELFRISGVVVTLGMRG